MRRYLHIIICCVAILFAACVSSRKGRLWSDISPYFEVPAKWQDDMGNLRSVLTFDNGEKVQNKSDWSARRDEIKRLWHESMGEWPEIITNQPLQRLDSVMLDDGILRYKVRFKWTPAEHSTLFVWDWSAGENRIASDFTRFYRIAKRVTRRIWLADLSGVVFVAGLGSLLTMGLPQKKRQSDCSVVVVCKSDSGGVRTHDPQLRRLLLYPTELRNQHYLHAKTKNNHRQNCIGQAFAMQM